MRSNDDRASFGVKGAAGENGEDAAAVDRQPPGVREPFIEHAAGDARAAACQRVGASGRPTRPPVSG